MDSTTKSSSSCVSYSEVAGASSAELCGLTEPESRGRGPVDGDLGPHEAAVAETGDGEGRGVGDDDARHVYPPFVVGPRPAGDKQARPEDGSTRNDDRICSSTSSWGGIACRTKSGW